MSSSSELESSLEVTSDSSSVSSLCFRDLAFFFSLSFLAFLAFIFRFRIASSSSSDDDDDESESSSLVDSFEPDVSSDEVGSSLSSEIPSFALDRFFVFADTLTCFLQHFVFFFNEPDSGGLESVCVAELSVFAGCISSFAFEAASLFSSILAVSRRSRDGTTVGSGAGICRGLPVGVKLGVEVFSGSGGLVSETALEAVDGELKRLVGVSGAIIDDESDQQKCFSVLDHTSSGSESMYI